MDSRADLTELDAHALGVGQIIGNLQSLELMLRMFLARTEPLPDGSASGPRLWSLEPGDELPVDAFTDYDSLREVILRYNTNPSHTDASCAVDDTIAYLRDALAHGRLLAEQPRRPIRLFRFSKPKAGVVTVTMAVDVTDDWIAAQRHRVYDELQKVRRALDGLGPPPAAG